MQLNTMNPSQMLILESFAAAKDEKELDELMDVLRDFHARRLERELEQLWEKSKDDRTLFNLYLEDWKSQTKFLSSTAQIKRNAAFRKIVNMGGNAVPFILEEISRKPSTLVWALNDIFHEKKGEGLTVTEACQLWISELKKS